MMEISQIIINNGWRPCFPGGDDVPDEGQEVLAIFHVHAEDWRDSLNMGLVLYEEDASGGRYWSNTCRCTVHPLCWHPLPDLPGFIGMKEQEGIDYIPFADLERAWIYIEEKD